MNMLDKVPRNPTPLWFFGLGGLIAEAILAGGAANLRGLAQTCFIVTAIVFLFGLFIFFGWVLIKKPWVFYPPSEYSNGTSPQEFIAAFAAAGPTAADALVYLQVGVDSPQETEDALVPAKDPEVATIPETAAADLLPGTFDDARSALIVAGLRTKDIGAVQRAFDSALALVPDAAQLGELTILREEMRYLNGAADALAILQEMTTHEETVGAAESALAFLAESTSDYASARDHYRNAAAASRNERRKADLVVSEYRAGYKDSSDSTFAAELAQQASAFSDPAAQAAVLVGAADIYKSAAQFDLQAITLDDALALIPNDLDVLFNCAYAYSNTGFKSLGMLHYRQLLDFDSNPMARNNLGVTLKDLELPVLAVKAYRAAFESGNTLSAANIATLLINAGFLEDADQVLLKAEATDSPHENVHHARARLSNAKDSEDKKVAELESAALAVRGFLRRFSAARRVATDAPGLAGVWSVPGVGLIDITLENGMVSFDSLPHRPSNSTDRFMADAQPITGNAARLKTRKGFWNTAGWIPSPTTDNFAYYDAVGDTVEFMTGTSSTKATMSTWTRFLPTLEVDVAG